MVILCNECQKASKPKINFSKIKWGAFTKQFKSFKSDNPRSDIDSLDDFADFIISNPDKFKKTTLKRAHFYKNVIEKGDKTGGISAKQFFDNIGRAFKATWNQKPTGTEKKALDVVLNHIEPALIKPISVIAPPVGKIAEMQRSALADKYLGSGFNVSDIFNQIKTIERKIKDYQRNIKDADPNNDPDNEIGHYKKMLSKAQEELNILNRMTGKGICHSRNAVAPDDLEHAIRMRVAQLRREVDADLLGSFTDPAHMPYVIDIARMTTPPEDPADRHFWNIITNELRQLAQQEIEAEQEEASDIETATEAETASNVSVASGRMCKRFM